MFIFNVIIVVIKQALCSLSTLHFATLGVWRVPFQPHTFCVRLLAYKAFMQPVFCSGDSIDLVLSVFYSPVLTRSFCGYELQCCNPSLKH